MVDRGQPRFSSSGRLGDVGGDAPGRSYARRKGLARQAEFRKGQRAIAVR
jgi:hypothetical protein